MGECRDPLTVFKYNILNFISKQLIKERISTSSEVNRHLSFLINKNDKKNKSEKYEYCILLRNIDILSQEQLESIARSLFDASEDWPLKLKECTYSSNKFNLQLDRKDCFGKFITKVCQRASGYGRRDCDPSGGKVNLILADLMYEERLTLNSLRAVLLAEHVQSLLVSRGQQCHLYLPRVREPIREELSKLGYTYPPEAEPSTVNRLTARLSHLPAEKSDVNRSRLRVGDYLEKEGLPRGKGGYSGNIEYVEVNLNDDGRLDVIADLDTKCESNETAIHVIGADHEFNHQKFDLLWKMAGGPRDQRHLVFGPVSRRGNSDDEEVHDIEEFINLRKRENHEASAHKFGTAAGAEWDTRIRSLAWAGIKFELLSSSARGEVKLDLSPEAPSSDHRAGQFVLYNYARLANLFRQYEKEVEQGLYPGLPAIGDVDFSLLREEEEWNLLLHYIVPYKGLVETILSEYDEGVRCKMPSHRICQFLTQLSRLLSSYYNRCHVLGESRSHLLPRMYARLYLLTAVKQVVGNGLHLLGIEPLERM